MSSQMMVGSPIRGSSEGRKRSDNPLDEASRLAAMAEQYEKIKNYKSAEDYNKQANGYYLEALATLKQKPHG